MSVDVTRDHPRGSASLCAMFLIGCAAGSERDGADTSGQPPPSGSSSSADSSGATQGAASAETGDSTGSATTTASAGTDDESSGTTGAVGGGLYAFPSAQGFGRDTVGGRGGQLIEVTTLADSGSGSLREALGAQGPRTIVFRTGGTITLTTPITIGEPFVTIAGQSAPGGGIAVRGAPLQIRTDEVIMRHVRIRTGYEAGWDPHDWDSLTLLSPEGGIDNVIIDHCSITWGIDENVGLNAGAATIQNVTLQWSIIAEGLDDSAHSEGPHSKGMLAYAPSGSVDRLSLHHNYLAHNIDRNILAGPNASFELVNNVVYNYGGGTALRDNVNADIVANHYIPGANTSETWMGMPRRSVAILPPGHSVLLYVEDNIGQGRPDNAGDDWDIVVGLDIDDQALRSLERLSDSEAIVIDPIDDVLDAVLADVGATFPARDAVDTRLVGDPAGLTGAVIDSPADVGGWPALAAGVPPPDEDHDGMSDEWEASRGLDPTDPADAVADDDGDGYTNVEEYLNSLIGR